MMREQSTHLLKEELTEQHENIKKRLNERKKGTSDSKTMK